MTVADALTLYREMMAALDRAKSLQAQLNLAYAALSPSEREEYQKQVMALRD